MSFFGLIGSDQKKTELTDFKNPFGKKKIERVWMNIRNMEVAAWNPGPSDIGRVEFDAIIYFKADNTKGEQVLRAESFGALVEKVNAFIKALD